MATGPVIMMVAAAGLLSVSDSGKEAKILGAMRKALSASGFDGEAFDVVLRCLPLSAGGDCSERRAAAAVEPIHAAALRAAAGSLSESGPIATREDARVETISIGEIQLDPIRRVVTRKSSSVNLSPKEFDLLHYLMARSGIPVRHVELLRKIWGSEYRHELYYLHTYVSQLRKKLEEMPSAPQYLLTQPCYGYRFVDSTAFIPHPNEPLPQTP